MEHMLLKAATSAVTEQGIFEAVISSATIDREKDIVSPTGMVAALKRWMPTGKKIPLAWQHSTAAEDIIGWVDPSSAKALGKEVVATGWIDQSIPRGAEAWRLVKAGVLGFSFGYLIPVGGAIKRAGGGRDINELDVFEITATPTPMQNDTRVLSFKGHIDGPPEVVEQWERAVVLEREARLEDEARRVGDQPPPAPAHEPVRARVPEPTPDARAQLEKAVALDREQTHQDREAEERSLPEIPPAAPPAPRRRRSQLVVLPDAGEQWRRAVALEREQQEADRAAEADRLPPTSPAPPAPAPRKPPAPPALEDQWHRATAIEREEHEKRRALEAQQLPEIPPAPEPEPVLEQPPAPDLESQWQRATAFEREQQEHRRVAETEQLPDLAPPEPEPPAAKPPEPPALEEQWQRATALEREQHERRRAAEREQLPDLGAPPEPEPPAAERPAPPALEAQWQHATALEREQLERDRALERARLPEMGPPPEPEEEKSVEPPELEGQWRRASTIEREVAAERRASEERYILEIETKAASDVGPHARDKLHGLIAYYMKKPHPFTECVRDNRKRFGPGAEAVCATLKDIGAGTTHWRHGSKPGKSFNPRQMRDQMGRWADQHLGGADAMASMTPGPGLGAHLPPPGPVQRQIDEWASKLLKAAGGNLDGLMEMLHEHMRRHGDTPPGVTKPKALDRDEQDRKAVQYEREARRAAEEEAIPDMEIDETGSATLRVPRDEAEGLTSGQLKAVWSTAYVNSLPDSAFLHIEDGGTKDGEGKTTPRSLRYFPYRDADGAVDVPHLRNALARIPQSSLPPAVKDRLTAKAQKLLDGQKALPPEFEQLPDSAFLYANGGIKHFPVWGANGVLDVAGLRHAVAQIPQSDLPLNVKDWCMRKAYHLLDQTTAEGANGRTAARPFDPLRAQADAAELEFASDGLSLRKPPQQKKAPSPTLIPLGELRRRMRQEMLTALSGVEEE